MQEQELLAQAKSGNENAFEILLNNYKHLVSSIARRYFLAGGNGDDLIQEGMIGLFKAIKSYDATKNNNFEVYAKTVIERQIINAIKSDSSLKNNPLNNSLTLNFQGGIETKDDNVIYLKNHKHDPEKMVLGEFQVKHMLKQIKDKLSDFELKVLSEYLEGKSYIEIASKLSVTTKSVDNALNRIKTKLHFLKQNKD